MLIRCQQPPIECNFTRQTVMGVKYFIVDTAKTFKVQTIPCMGATHCPYLFDLMTCLTAVSRNFLIKVSS